MPPRFYIYHHEFYVDESKEYYHLVITRESNLIPLGESIHYYGNEARDIYKQLRQFGTKYAEPLFNERRN